MTMQQVFLAQQQVPVQRRPPEDIPITYKAEGGPPPPPGGGREMVKSYGPAKLAKSRYTPFQGGPPPSAPGGATSPMPTPTIQRQKFTRETVPIRREYFPPRPAPAPPPPPQPPQQPKRKATEPGIPVSLKPHHHHTSPYIKPYYHHHTSYTKYSFIAPSLHYHHATIAHT